MYHSHAQWVMPFFSLPESYMCISFCLSVSLIDSVTQWTEMNYLKRVDNTHRNPLESRMDSLSGLGRWAHFNVELHNFIFLLCQSCGQNLFLTSDSVFLSELLIISQLIHGQICEKYWSWMSHNQHSTKQRDKCTWQRPSVCLCALFCLNPNGSGGRTDATKMYYLPASPLIKIKL